MAAAGSWEAVGCKKQKSVVEIKIDVSYPTLSAQVVASSGSLVHTYW